MNRYKSLIIAAICLALNTEVLCASILFSNVTKLFIAAASAKLGDILILAAGTYIYDSDIHISVSGLTIKASAPGSVIITQASASSLGIHLKVVGSRNTITGFQFINGHSVSGNNIIDVTGSNNTFSQLNFYNMKAMKYINLQVPSQHNLITNCNFEYKPTSAKSGNLVEIEAHPSIPGYHVVRNCTFQNMPGSSGDNGNENIRIGEDSMHTYVARAVVEYCVFNNTGLGDSEIISVKSRQNTIRYCTFSNNQNAMVSFRNGDYNVAYGNFFIGSGGVRAKQANNIFVYNNYFQSSGSAAKKTYPVDFFNLTGYPPWYAYRNNFSMQFNTFVYSGVINLDSPVRKYGNFWGNNIFLAQGSSPLFKGATTGTSFSGNIYSGGTLGATFQPPSAALGVNRFSATQMRQANPLLTLNSWGFYSPSASSPAIGSAILAGGVPIYDIPHIDDDPHVLRDITGRTRTGSLKDVGCFQTSSTGKVINTPLNVYNTGPSYRPQRSIVFSSSAPTVAPSYSFAPSAIPTTNGPGPAPASSAACQRSRGSFTYFFIMMVGINSVINVPAVLLCS
jgi:poly(beta-D-mannuronate) lyase